MLKKLTNEIVDERIKNTNFIRLENYIRNGIKIKFLCKVCLSVKRLPPSYVFSGRGCSKCSGLEKITNEILDERIKNTRVIRVGSIKNVDIAINFACKDCNYIWSTAPGNIMYQNTACPLCAGHEPLTNEIIDDKIKNRSIKRLGSFVKQTDDLLWLCLKCNKTWESSLSSVVYNENGCIKCSGLEKITDSIIDERLKNRKITRIQSILEKNTSLPIKFSCNECNYEWSATASNIFSGTGCPLCNRCLGEKTVQKILEKNKIYFISQYPIYVNNTTDEYPKKIDFYLNEYNLFIEFNGEQHYKPVNFSNSCDSNLYFEKQKMRDNLVRNFCKINNIYLFEIDSRIYKNGTRYSKNFEIKLECDILDFISKI